MRTLLNSALASVLLLAATPAVAQHEGHTMPAAQAGAANSEQVTACVQSQRQVKALVDAGNRRLEAARQTNDAAAMRSAIDDFQATLSAVRSQLASCAQLAAAAPAADPHAGHVIPSAPNVQQSPASQPGTPVMQPGTTLPAPGAVSRDALAPAAAAAAAPAAPAAAAPDAHAGHTMPAAPQAGLIKDPRCRENVDPKTAPQASHDGQTYYFCSESDRQRFVADPARYLQAGAAAATDPHAGHAPAASAAAPRTGTPPRATQRTGAAPAKPAAPTDPHAGHAAAGAQPATPARQSQGSRAAGLDIAFRTIPSPPRGAAENQFDVTVKDRAGKPVDGAEVSLLFYMAAMPQTNMPEMRNEVKLKPAGNGRYTGAGQVAMAGPWTVTVTVAQGGREIGQHKLAITAK